MKSLERFNFCPLRSLSIKTRDEALSYYAHKLVGDHSIVVKGQVITVRFNAEEIHLFSEKTGVGCPPCSSDDVMQRSGSSREVRCFNRDRARRLDDVLPTLTKASVIHRAKMPRGVIVFGPAVANAQRMAVVIAPEGPVWFVRTSWGVSAEAFRKACGNNRPAPWP